MYIALSPLHTAASCSDVNDDLTLFSYLFVAVPEFGYVPPLA